ncbi:DUF3299 domain-containing protein [Veronia pacifica]|uniref:DUF3299 domain-containing protein n=1 Tax=Veronia pacifica TaxID=1080227 RepID=A0A1C3EIC4_9GAMM|nr:DUF3299 domain-containing protein [Veronia pacifica]ODA32996.1 hypothetical protein A8L45_11920 [Veronia pacifica]
MKKFLSWALLGIAMNVSAAPELSLSWEDLVPESERLLYSDQPIISHQGEPIQSRLGKVRNELNNSFVGLSGFVIPLEGDVNSITEFLLVPFMGACIHVPPPPPNQIVYVKFDKGVPPSELWDIVYVTGKLRTVAVDTDGILSGYVLEGKAVRPYDDAIDG